MTIEDLEFLGDKYLLRKLKNHVSMELLTSANLYICNGINIDTVKMEEITEIENDINTDLELIENAKSCKEVIQLYKKYAITDKLKDIKDFVKAADELKAKKKSNNNDNKVNYAYKELYEIAKEKDDDVIIPSDSK